MARTHEEAEALLQEYRTSSPSPPGEAFRARAYEKAARCAGSRARAAGAEACGISLRLLAPQARVAAAPLDQAGIVDPLVRFRQTVPAQKLQNVER